MQLIKLHRDGQDERNDEDMITMTRIIIWKYFKEAT